MFSHHIFSLRREYLPISMEKLQRMIDTDRLDISKPIDVTQICNTGLFKLDPASRQYGFQLKDEGIDKFKAKIHIEVQHASELVISAIERNGGVIRTAYYDMNALVALKNTKNFFERGVPIPHRMIPPQDAIEYYTDPKTRGYLADPEAISHERLVCGCDYMIITIRQLFTFEFKNDNNVLSFLFRCWHKSMVMNYQKSKMIHSMKCFRKSKTQDKYSMVWNQDGLLTYLND